MAKQLLIDLETYETELKQAETNGKAIMMAAVRDIIETGGQNVQLSDKASAELRKFVEDVKVAMGKTDETK